jgi:hypothetical protein
MATDSITPRTRRAVLVGGLAAAAAGTLGRAHPASAHDTDDVRKGVPNATTNLTTIYNTTTDGSAFEGDANGGGVGVAGSSISGMGVYGLSNSGTAVSGASTSGMGVSGSSDSSTGVYGSSNATAIYGTSPGGYGVYGRSGLGTAVFGWSTSGTGVYAASDSDAAPAAFAQSFGGNSGLQAYSGPNMPPASAKKVGVFGSADTDVYSVGVRGVSPTGRGGRFKGKKAQIRLDPSADATHPPSGARGDLFVDASGRLWFCKGGTTWKQLA